MKPRARSPQRILLLAVVWALVASVFVAGVALAASGGARLRYVPNEYIIHVKPGTSLPDVRANADRLGASVVKSLPLADTYLIRLGRASSVRSTTGTRAVAAVRWAIDRIQPNYYKYLSAIPNDPSWDKLWGMRMIHAPEAWDIEKGSNTVTVAIIDSGVAEHPEFAGRLLDGVDYIDPTQPNGHMDKYGHGTHVAGTIAAQGDNGIGVVGVCWDNVNILPVRVFDGDGATTTDAIMSAYNYVLQSDAQVLNLSLGGDTYDAAEHDMIRALVAKNIVVCASAGNGGNALPNYPAAYAESISVSALGPDETLAYYSTYGKVDLAAPGGAMNAEDDPNGIYSTYPVWSEDPVPVLTFSYKYEQGTSMACPHVSGAAALLVSHGLAPSLVRERLQSTARLPITGIVDPSRYGYGIIDLKAALSSSTLKITRPLPGATTTGSPQFRITAKGVDSTSIRVYLDYADTDDDGTPDNANDYSSVIIDPTSIDSYMNATTGIIALNWPIFGRSVLSPGVHKLYVSAVSIADGSELHDWCTFHVSNRIIKAGIHLFAFPYWRSNSGAAGTIPADTLPSAMLTEVGTSNNVAFLPNGTNRASLMRWLPETSITRSIPYFQHYDGVTTTVADRLAWNNPQDLGFYTGGGFSVSNPNAFKFPAGSGFWLYLPRDAQIKDSFEPMLPDDAFSIYLYAGWNMIGNPFNRETAWGTSLFRYRGEGPKTLLEAEAAGWIKANLFEWNSDTGRYVNVSARDLLKPYNGYWLYANVGSSAAGDQLTVTVTP